MIIDAATRDDIPALVRMVNAAFRGTQGEAGWTHETEILSGPRVDATALGEMLSDERSAVLVLREVADGGPIGCVAVLRLDNLRCEFSMLAVDPKQQTVGLGRQLMAAAEAYARKMSATHLQATVISIRESLIAYYERQGYRRTGATKPFPYGDESVGRPLRDDLHFIVIEKAL